MHRHYAEAKIIDDIRIKSEYSILGPIDAYLMSWAEATAIKLGTKEEKVFDLFKNHATIRDLMNMGGGRKTSLPDVATDMGRELNTMLLFVLIKCQWKINDLANSMQRITEWRKKFSPNSCK
jgi:hypothetical protein